MQNSIIRTAILFFFLSVFASQGVAQKRIDGNGQRQTITRQLADFTKVEISLSANVTIRCHQEESAVSITADENLLEYIKTEVVGNRLIIDQIGWIEGFYELTVSTSQLEKITRGSWGETFVKSIDGDRLQIEGEVGSITLDGKVDQLIINNEQTTIDASQLLATRGRIRSTGYGNIKVHIKNIERVRMEGSGRLITYGDPTFAERPDSEKVVGVTVYRETPKVELRYFALKLYNNSFSQTQFRVEGPPAKPFGYGIRIGPYSTRNENFPVGTKIYQKGLLGEKLLVTIRAEDEGQQVKLFGR